MNLSSIGYFNFYNIKQHNNNNQQKPNNRYICSTLNRDTVQFTSAAKILSSIHDKAFVDILAKDLQLTKESAIKLKNVVWNYLRENKIDSLSDIGGEDFIEEQTVLQRKIISNLGLSEDTSEFICYEVVKRCDEGNKYIPGGLSGLKKEQEIENFLFSHDIKGYFKELLVQDADNKFYEYISKALRLSPKENYEFRKTIENFLQDNKVKSLDEFSGEEWMEEQAELVDLLTNKFDLNEAEKSAVQWEIISRCFDKSEYNPTAMPYVKDCIPLRKILEDGGYNHKTGGLDSEVTFFDEIYRLMTKEADSKNYENIFEIFKSENNPINSETFKFIQNSKLSKDESIDLLLDLEKVSQNPEEYALTVPKHPVSDDFYGSLCTDIMAETIAEKYCLGDFLCEDMKKILAKLGPEHVEGSQNCDIRQIAYEIANKYGLPGGAEKDLINIINQVKSKSIKELDAYLISKLFSEVE